MAHPIRLVMVLAVLFVVAGCTSDDGAADEPTETGSTEATVTTAPAATAVAELAVTVPGPGEPWDLVVINDKRNFGEAFLETYADAASGVLGVDVNATYAGIEGNTAWKTLDMLRGDTSPDIGGIVREAEIVVMLAWPERSNDGDPTHIDVDGDNCSIFTSNVTPKPPAPTTPDYWQPYTDLLDDIYTEIWSLREGTPTVVIGPDIHNHYIKRQREAGIYAECIAWTDAWSAVVRETAEKHGALYVPLSDVLSGPNHDIDAFEAGYTGPTGEYPTIWFGTPNEVGTPMIVDAMVAAGFQPATQP